MLESNIKSPGVYIDEVNAFPNSVAAVPTAIPAFVGYTPQASYEGKSYTNVPQSINSFKEFQAIFCLPDSPPPAPPAKQYSPQYYLVKQESQPQKGDYLQLEDDFYAILPDPNTIYYLYNSVRLFYENGGGQAYILSVGSYGNPSGKPNDFGDPIVNQNVQLNDLLNGIALLKNEQEPTLYICPEATLLSIQDNGTLMQAMLLQNENMGTAISILDVIGGRAPDPINYTQDIETFRNHTGSQGLGYGAAYYPFIGTTIMQQNDLDYTNLFGGDLKSLEKIINPTDHPNQAVTDILKQVSAKTLTPTQANTALINASKPYATIMTKLLNIVNLLPPSGGMAGVYCSTDNNSGVWKAPANTSIVGAVSLPIKLSNSEQEVLNTDTVSSKSINAIRFFKGQGILVWGARTLDGNNYEKKYISVRRTLIMIEQSCKLATQAYVFSPNVHDTWEAIKTMIGNFLSAIWQEGGLQGAKASDAYSVDCGLGSTMTSEDVTMGTLRVAVKAAIIHPSEFIILEFEQEMTKV